MTNKDYIRYIISKIIVNTGMCKLSRFLYPKDGCIILYGHRVEGNDEGFLSGLHVDDFESIIKYLSKYYHFISLSELVECYRYKKKVPKMSVVLTFDDGFKDNYINALPIMEKYNVPSTIFLATGCIDSGRLPWPQRLGYIIQRTGKKFFPKDNYNENEIFLGNNEDRRKVTKHFRKKLSTLSAVSREKYIDELSAILEVTEPSDRMLTWEQVKEMKVKGVTFGAHSVSHSLLGQIEFNEAKEEIDQSAKRVKEVLEINSLPFAFPGGSISQELVDYVRERNFDCLFMPGRSYRVNTLQNTTRYSLARIGIINGSSDIMQAELDGPLNIIRNICLKRK